MRRCATACRKSGTACTISCARWASARVASSTSTTALPTRARSPQNAVRSRRWVAPSSRPWGRSRTRCESSTPGRTVAASRAAIRSPRRGSRPCLQPGSASTARPAAAELDPRALSGEVEERLVFFACLFLAIILHEISHGVVALFFGDDTAKRAGRLTLNPIPHIDPFGSIILPAMLTITGFGAFGWAKPVPVDPGKLRNPRRQMLFVGLAGPLSNFALMVAAALAARAAFGAYTGNAFRIADLPLVIQVLLFFALANLVLGLFNLLPIPPLDGSSLIERVLPRDWLPGWYRFRPYGILVLLIVGLSTNLFGRLFSPFIDGLFNFIVR